MPTYRATVTEIEELAPSVLQLTVSINDDGFRFEPGQWVNFRFPEGVSRAYTIASAPQRPEAVQLCVRLGPGKGGAPSVGGGAIYLIGDNSFAHHLLGFDA